MARCAHDGTYDSLPRVIVASQLTMVLIVTTGMILLFASSNWGGVVFHYHAAGRTPEGKQWVSTWSSELSILSMSLAAAGVIGLVLLARRSWWTALGWLTMGILTTQFITSNFRHGMYIIKYPEGGHGTYFRVVLAGTGFVDAGTWWAATASYWVLYAALTLLIHHKTHRVIRLLAGAEVVAIPWLTRPDWAYEYADRLGVVDLVHTLAHDLNMPISHEISAVKITLGITVPLSVLTAMAAGRCLAITKTLILPPRRKRNRACPVM